MKRLTFFKKIYLIKVFSVLLFFAVLSSCKKKDEMEITPSATDVKAQVSNESLIKFLSITLDVKKSEIAFNPLNDEFIIRGQLKLSRTEIEGHYNDANVYQTIYGK